ncbi:hypothetical protein ACFXGR_52630 [Streptomyces mirabilis]|uniref:hypothetical protein n=1 Tax=Streptomyces mirabilis TaxID=68239 RepID=UPI0036A8800A
MTDTLRTPPPPPPTAAPQHRRLFTLDPGRWEAERSRALRTGHVRDHTWAPAIPGSLRFSAAAVALISLLAGLFAMGHGVPAETALPGMVLAPLLAEHLPRWLDARAREHVRSVEGDGACRYLQRLGALHTSLVRAAAGRDRYDLRRAAEIGQHLLWDAAGLLQTQDTRSASADLIARERLMVQLADQVTPSLRTHTEDGPADADQPGWHERPLGPYTPGFKQTARPFCLPSPRLDPDQPAQDTADSRPAPQHNDLLLQPRYTVDLPPLDEEEDTFSPPPPAQKRRGAARGR